MKSNKGQAQEWIYQPWSCIEQDELAALNDAYNVGLKNNKTKSEEE
jgi:hypothetical protein